MNHIAHMTRQVADIGAGALAVIVGVIWFALITTSATIILGSILGCIQWW